MPPLGSEGDPPGTQWLKRNLQQRRQPTPQELKQIQEVSDNEPGVGSWQFAIDPLGSGNWNVQMSPPESGDWQIHSSHRDLGDALKAIGILRVNPESARWFR